MTLSKDQFGALAAQTSVPGGGATVSADTGQPVKSGWATAVAGREQQVPAADFDAEDIQDYTEKNANALAEPGKNLGLWHAAKRGGRPGTVFMDTTEVRPDTYEGGLKAINATYDEGQEASYNIDRDETLYSRPANRPERRDTRKALKSLEAKSGRDKPRKLSDLPTGTLRDALRNRREV